jgi:hypothetical protein
MIEGLAQILPAVFALYKLRALRIILALRRQERQVRIHFSFAAFAPLREIFSFTVIPEEPIIGSAEVV